MLGALSFTSPFLLAALATLPVIWLLLRATPPAPVRVRFPAFDLLKSLQTNKETPHRTPWWLLLLRLMIAAIIIIGLAGPILNAPPPSTTTGPLVFVVDDSWAAAANWRKRTDALAEGAEEAVQANRTVFMLTTTPENAPAALVPMTGEAFRGVAASLTPKPFAADRTYALARLDELDTAITGLGDGAEPEIRWLADGLTGEGDAAFADALKSRGALTVFAGDPANIVILRALGDQPDGPTYRVERLKTGAALEAELAATARDGRELTRLLLELKPETKFADLTLDLPLALRNELGRVRLENALSAGAIHFADARNRRALIGLLTDAPRTGSNLLSGSHYVQKALAPYAEFLTGDIASLLASDVSVIVLDDIGRLRDSDVEGLADWVNRGGVLIRFAGPVLAGAAQDGAPPLLPVRLRGGGRAFGGALTWDTPQRLESFSADGPFAGLDAPGDVFIRRQVLANPGGETTKASWAQLADGTPLVTGTRDGAGAIALFHITATPEWSDLPLSGVFIDMLRRLTFLSTLGPESPDESGGEQAEAQMRYQPFRLLDGFGRLQRPIGQAPALTAAQIDEPPAPGRRPGLYGPPDAPLALNAVSAKTPFEPMALANTPIIPFETAPPVRIGPFLIAAALALFLIDGIVSLLISGRLRLPRVAAATSAALIAALAVYPGDAVAQPLDPAIDPQSKEAALETRLAYVLTGDDAVDRLSGQALAALSRELIRRTSVEPGPPAGIDPETDDLSVYPFLYWPIVPGAAAPSDAALTNIENFMRFGGMILFDTRDDERSVGGATTPENQALRAILSQLDAPPLTPVSDGHVLMRSFYLLDDLRGRQGGNPVWVEVKGSGANDGVTSVIIGGRDWAGAWASDEFGRPTRSMGRGGARARELSYRAGVNVIMVALTGNYKSDQVHTPILLERLGQ